MIELATGGSDPGSSIHSIATHCNIFFDPPNFTNSYVANVNASAKFRNHIIHAPEPIAVPLEQSPGFQESMHAPSHIAGTITPRYNNFISHVLINPATKFYHRDRNEINEIANETEIILGAQFLCNGC